MRFHVELLLAVLLLAGCAVQDVVSGTTKEAVAEAPCKKTPPARPIFPADALTGDEDIFTMGQTIWADRLERRAYERQLEVYAEECSRSSTSP